MSYWLVYVASRGAWHFHHPKVKCLSRKDVVVDSYESIVGRGQCTFMLGSPHSFVYGREDERKRVTLLMSSRLVSHMYILLMPLSIMYINRTSAAPNRAEGRNQTVSIQHLTCLYFLEDFKLCSFLDVTFGTRSRLLSSSWVRSPSFWGQSSRLVIDMDETELHRAGNHTFLFFQAQIQNHSSSCSSLSFSFVVAVVVIDSSIQFLSIPDGMVSLASLSSGWRKRSICASVTCNACLCLWIQSRPNINSIISKRRHTHMWE